jgi:hypothetical protein
VTFSSGPRSTTLLFCLGCDVVAIPKIGEYTTADIDRGHNAILDFFRGLYPQNQALQQVARNKPEEVFSAQGVVEWAKFCTPNDPLLKRAETMTPDELTNDVLEELATKATAAAKRSTTRKPTKRRSK